MTKKEHIVVGLDIGTTKICAVVGEILADLALEGKTSHPVDLFRLERFS